ERRMVEGNCSALNEFIFLGITGNRDIKLSLFPVFLLVYLFGLLANLGMVTVIMVDPYLHPPMYFFLSHLTLCDLCYSIAIGSKMLVNLVAQSRSISFLVCALWFLTFYIFADSEYLLLVVMAFDQYRAINSPLLYTAHMSSRLCSLLVGTILFMYFHLSSSYSLDQDKMISLFYTLVIPMLNLLIYSLWNKDVKEALQKMRNKKWF
ncbi:Olfactory receptor 5W2, partial [Heterocephalus glaber]